MILGKTVTILSLLITGLLVTNIVSAIGISPSRIDINFEPGFTETYNFYVRAGSYGNLRVQSQCELSEYIKPSIGNITVTPGEVRYFTVTIELPDEIEKPGTYRCGVTAEEVPVGEVPGVVAYSAVETPILIRVPYPYKYLEAKLNAPNVELSQPVNFRISLISRGLEDVTAFGVIRVTEIDGKNIATLYTEPILIKSRETGTLEAVWQTTGIPPGKYYAASTVEYGGNKTADSSTSFKIGDLLIEITNVTYPEIHPDDIVKFEVDLDSYWNSEITNAYMVLEADSEGNFAGSSTSETFNIDAWGSKTVAVFWDTSDLDAGDYDITFTAHYSNRTSEKIMNVEIKEPYNLYLILILIAVIVAMLALVIYFLAKRKKKKGELNAF